ncbi:calcium-binding protein [Cyanobium sp. LEGE 06113]|uniref:calcium-binding protein n=1 Tax=Cyanobium sp. LEGE 06113 TaxID=1297573 RepID=UPI00188022B9|nr:hypothetical protein [Cyanobium sp. LEGE 06113]MBE9155172.1 hypothetical protein [Cyanobium sp. LEGE 06113]
MALPSLVNIAPGDPGQTFIGNDTDEAFELSSSGGTGEIRNFIVKGEGGDDTLVLSGAPNQTNVFGNDGDDLISVENSGSGALIDSKFFAGAGDDAVVLQDLVFIGSGQGTSQVGMAAGDDVISLRGNFNNVNLFANDGEDTIVFNGSSSFQNSRAFTGDDDDIFTDNGNEVDFTNAVLGFKGGDDTINLSNSITGSGDNGLEVFLGDGDDFFAGPESGDLELMAGTGDDTIAGGGTSDTFTGGEGADLYIQANGASASVISVLGGQPGVPLTLTFAADPDIITDFETAAGAGAPADRIAFSGWGGPSNFTDNRSSASGSFGSGNVVLYSGNFNETGNIFTTASNNAGPDVLAFLSTGTGNIPGDFGDQAFVLLDASDQSFNPDTDFL